MKNLALTVIIVLNGLLFVEAASFIGLATYDCLNCTRFIVSIDSATGVAQPKVDILPRALGKVLDLVHAASDPVYGNYYILANVPAEKQMLVYNDYLQKITVSQVGNPPYDDIVMAYSMCYSYHTSKLYGLGWLTGDTPDILTAFSIDTYNFQITRIVDLPAVVTAMPNCAIDDDHNKLYFYVKNIDPAGINIWEIDTLDQTISKSWTIPNTNWTVPFLFKYNEEESKIVGLVADGALNTWLVDLDTTSDNPIVPVAGLPDTLPSVFSYNPITYEFVYISRKPRELVTVSSTGQVTNRVNITGLPSNSHVVKMDYFSLH